MDRNQGYTILKAVMLENGRGFALGEHPRAPSPFVTWACYDDEHGARQYEWGHYGSDRAALEQDLLERVENYQQQFSVKVAQIEAPGLYKYYSTQRPVDIGTFPKPAGNAPDEIVNYDKRVSVEGGALGPPHKTRERRAATRCLLTGQTYGPGAPHFKQVRDKLSQGEDRLKGGTFRSAAFSRFPTNQKRKRRFCRETDRTRAGTNEKREHRRGERGCAG